IACDQYTSQKDYWEKADKIAGDAPSALRLVLPEACLDETEARLPAVNRAMEDYLSGGALVPGVLSGFVLTLRKTPSGARPGLVGMVDLEAYDFAPGTDKPIRASESTILERLPPRIRVREGALLECPHVMLLADDPEGTLVEAALERVKGDAPIYDFELMLGGGHLTGWKIENAQALSAIDAALQGLYARNNGFLFAVGDGNHSLATAKACWEKRKAGLSETERASDPARFALVEVVNLHCPALVFRPIHRAVFGAEMDELIKNFERYNASLGLKTLPGGSICFTDGRSRAPFCVTGDEALLDAARVQPWLDSYLKRHPGCYVDYVHGEEALKEVCLSKNAVGIELGTIDKSALFPSVARLGVLPRKAFSMGEADEKRFYMEARRIK
ncbi:MAG: DUF1015 domain-containing protein, partial [Clostridia bacterium]|nr:DUF1015 domain-containing protein [Clostridia bacterium]